MKKLILLAMVAALSACTQKADEAKDTTTAPVEETMVAPADATSAPGTYDVKMADGTVGKTVINADGTYVDTDPNGKEIKGSFVHKDGKDCFDPEGDEAEMCWAVSTPGADGSFTATSPDGTVVTVTPSKG